jgi:hypothetical protein
MRHNIAREVAWVEVSLAFNKTLAYDFYSSTYDHDDWNGCGPPYNLTTTSDGEEHILMVDFSFQYKPTILEEAGSGALILLVLSRKE